MENPDRGFRAVMWTFTSKKACPISRLGPRWADFCDALQKEHDVTLKGVRVFEIHPGFEVSFASEDKKRFTPVEHRHPEITGRFARPAHVETEIVEDVVPGTVEVSHGWHVHLATPRWYDVKLLRRVAARFGFGRVHVSTEGRKGKSVKDAARYMAKYVSKGFSSHTGPDGEPTKSRPHYLKGIRLWARVGKCPGVRVSTVVAMGAFPEACRLAIKSLRRRLTREALRQWRSVVGQRDRLPGRVGWVMGVDAWPEYPAQAGTSHRSIAMALARSCPRSAKLIYRQARAAFVRTFWTKRVIFRALNRVRQLWLECPMAATLRYHGVNGHKDQLFSVGNGVFFRQFPTTDALLPI